MKQFRLFALLTFLLVPVSVLAEKSEYQPLANWKNDVLYAVMVDRFYDGDPGNNGGTPKNIFDFQGGDLYGLILKLDYLKSLGVSALVLSPITDSPAYHGYHPSDLFKVNPRFGSLKTLQDLIYQAHIRGIKIIFDLVLNHMDGNSEIFKQHPAWFRQPKDFVSANEKHFPDIRSQISFFALADINHQSAEVFEYQKKAAFFWIDQGVDGFRMDAVNQIEPEYWQKLNRAIKEYAGTDFFILGEHFEELTDVINHYAPYFDALYDFQFYYTLNEVLIKNHHPKHLYYSEIISSNISNKALTLIPFADNHDVYRFVSEYKDRNPNADSGATSHKLEQALALTFTRPGPPYLLYGTEIGLQNNLELKKSTFDASRSTMLFENNENNSIFNFIKVLSQIRKNLDWQNVQKFEIARLTELYVEGFIANDQKFIFVYNLSNQAKTISFSLRPFKDLPQSAELRDQINAEIIRFNSGKVSIPMKSQEVRIFTLK